MKKIINICLLVFLFIIFNSNRVLCFEKSNNLFLGFLDYGDVHEEGTAFIGIDDYINEDKRVFDGLISKTYIKPHINKTYFEISDSKIERCISFQKSSKFRVYSNHGYLGEYGIDKYVIIVNPCGGSYYLYAKLNGKINDLGDMNVKIVAQLIPKGEAKNERFKVFKKRKLVGIEKSNIENILNKKFTDFKNNKSVKQNCPVKYEAFKVGPSKNKKFLLMINAVWDCNVDRAEISYLLNTFWVEGKKITDIKPIRWSGPNDEIKFNILFGLGINGKVYWLVETKLFEGRITELIELKDRQEELIVGGNYFGC